MKFNRATVRGGDATGQQLEAVAQMMRYAVFQGTNRAAQDQLVRDDVLRPTATHHAETDDPRLERRNRAADQALRGHDDARADQNRVDAALRFRARVGGHAAHGDPKIQAAAHDLGVAHPELPYSDLRDVVQRQRRAHALVNARLEQLLRTALAGGIVAEAFLSRLKHQPDRAREIARDQRLRCPEQHRRVRVVTASVHDASVQARVFQAGLLIDRQCIHVRPQRDHWASAAHDVRDDTRATDTRARRQAQIGQRSSDDGRRAVLGVREFWVHVQIAVNRGQVKSRHGWYLRTARG